ncbi:SPOR domain-containing protein [Mucilaginibacter celer]|uniref:SPOR domain-containing protein n=1 Tax=Mucilaginibacter celer TaxID=2305508 RepID=A0A494W293_9SPHI|nr:SPOR domain-containing protein [Mucilaginibacter celer]AYL97392.1 SPOR domain-containing protein [Mucilaginibacter celer]
MKKAVFDQSIQQTIIKYCFFVLLLLASTQTFAQTRGKVEVVKDPLVDTLIARRFSLNGQTGIDEARSAYGYRVQFFSGSNRKDAYKAQAKLQTEYPELRTYISYREPNFKVKAGDFRTRIEAEKLVQEIRPYFSSIFILPEKINLPKADTNND